MSRGEAGEGATRGAWRLARARRAAGERRAWVGAGAVAGAVGARARGRERCGRARLLGRAVLHSELVVRGPVVAVVAVERHRAVEPRLGLSRWAHHGLG